MRTNRINIKINKNKNTKKVENENNDEKVKIINKVQNKQIKISGKKFINTNNI